MARFSTLRKSQQKSTLALDCPEFPDAPFVAAKPLQAAKVALISSAGLIARGDAPVRGGEAGYRAFPGSLGNAGLLISHISINFDRTAAMRSLESIFPRRLLSEMQAAGEVGAVADTHYSFMGATDPMKMQTAARQLAGSLKQQGVNTVVLLPV